MPFNTNKRKIETLANSSLDETKKESNCKNCEKRSALKRVASSTATVKSAPVKPGKKGKVESPT
jgi:hypothetical protein